MGCDAIKTQIYLDLTYDQQMLLMIEKAKRGGLCFVGSQRHVKANNKYLDNYDENKHVNYLMYWDANNLYGWAMSEPLPHKPLNWNTKITLEDILATLDDNSVCNFVEVDLEYPVELHDNFKEFPP